MDVCGYAPWPQIVRIELGKLRPRQLYRLQSIVPTQSDAIGVPYVIVPQLAINSLY